MENQKSWILVSKKYLAASFNPVAHELNELDWKLSLSEDKSKFSKHISAFANQKGGGFFVFGITPKGDYAGITNDEGQEIIRKLSNLARESVEPPQKIDHFFDDSYQSPVLFIHIPESIQKPVHIRGKGIEFSYLRSGGQTRKMSLQEIANAVLNSRQVRFEELEAVACSQNKINDFLDYEPLFNLLSIPLPDSHESTIDHLINQKILYRNGEQCSITNLGAIAAAKDLRQFPGKERLPVRVIKYRGASKLETEGEKEFYQGYGVGFQTIIRYIMEQLPTSEVVQDALRKNVPVYPEITIRELVANALIHRDFTVTSTSPMVEIYSDRMEIISPGELLPSVGIDRIIDSAPESRNEIFAGLMRRMGICEERGSGIDKALFAVEFYGLPPIDFINGPNVFKAIVYHPKKFKQMSQKERLNACYQHCCLKWVSRDFMTNTSFRKRLGLNDDQYVVSWRVIDSCIEAGLIKSADINNKARKYAKYIPAWA
jgi:predicted HTH transcriptional regulator